MIIGYTTGVFDLFHIGHVNLLMNAKSMCDRLIVGVSVDKLAEKKPRNTVIPFEERIQVVRACKYVDVAIPQIAQNKFEVWQKLKYNILFVGDDWYKTESWQDIEKELAKNEVKIIYFPYTHGTSSTIINNTIDQLRINFSEKK